jgi:hypothetical protein
MVCHTVLLFVKNSFGRPYYRNLKSIYETTILEEAIKEGLFNLNTPEGLAKFYESQVGNLWGNADRYLA